MTSPPNQPGQGDSDEQPEEQSSSSPENAEPTEQSASAEHSTTESDSTAGTPSAPEDETASDAQPAAAQPSPEEGGQQETPAGGEATGETAEHSAEADEQAGRKKKRKRAGLIIGAAAAVVVIGGAVGGYFLFFSSGSAEATAEHYVELSAKETQEPRSVSAEDYRPVVCQQAMPQIEQLQQQKQMFLEQANPEDLEQVKQVETNLEGVQEDGDSGTATIQTVVPGQEPQSAELDLIKEDGDWKLCG